MLAYAGLCKVLLRTTPITNNKMFSCVQVLLTGVVLAFQLKFSDDIRCVTEVKFFLYSLR